MTVIDSSQDNAQKETDAILHQIAEYVMAQPNFSDVAYDTAFLALLDSIGCMVLATKYAACTRLLGPIVPGTIVPNGCRVPTTNWEVDPVLGAANIGMLVRWLDYNDTWLAQEWGHPSDNLGGILAVMDYMNRSHDENYTIKDVLTAMIQAYEIQGCLALVNSFNRIGFDHVILVKVASAAVCARLLGGDMQQVMDACSHAWIDTGPMRTYRHAPNTGSRKSWAAGDATSRGVYLALLTMRGEQGYTTPVSAKTWGLNDVIMREGPLTLEHSLGCYVMENILFKISYPAEFHAQTAVEAALQLHEEFRSKGLDQVERIALYTQEAGVRIISKTGSLRNPADRDHCLQYMVAIALLYGELTAEHYEDHIAREEKIDRTRELMSVQEDTSYTEGYFNAEERSIGNAVQIFYKDGTSSEKVEVLYPLGHRFRREEGRQPLFDKFKSNLASHYHTDQIVEIEGLLLDHDRFVQSSVDNLMGLLQG